MTTPDFRALCAELIAAVDNYETDSNIQGIYDDLISKGNDVFDRARAALAEGEKGPAINDDAWSEFVQQVERAQHVAIREGECPRFDLKELALALWREANEAARYGTTPPRPVPVAEPADNVRYEFSVFNGEDELQAGGEAPTLEQAQREGRHYLAQYEADGDGPYRLELREVRVLPAHAIPTPENTDD